MNCDWEEVEQLNDELMTTIYKCSRCKKTTKVHGDRFPPTEKCRAASARAGEIATGEQKKTTDK
jgi:hypothetical protein